MNCGKPIIVRRPRPVRAALTGALMAGAGCLAPNEIVCADGTVCPADRVCAPAGGGCPEAEQVSACEGQAEGAPCTLGSIGGGTCRAGVCAITGCGDGAVDVGEACDDGNEVDDDACTNTCTLPVCGDRIRQGGEACDEGVANGDDRACTSTCAVAACGDGLVQAGVHPRRAWRDRRRRGGGTDQAERRR